jgi:hypothetical protein
MEPEAGALWSDLPAVFPGLPVIADVTLEELYLGTGIGHFVCLTLIAALGSQVVVVELGYFAEPPVGLRKFGYRY